MNSIASRLFLAFITVVFFLVVQGAVAAYTARKISQAQEMTKEEELAITRLQSSLSENRLLVFRLLSTMDPYRMDILRSRHRRQLENISRKMQDLGVTTSLLDALGVGYDEIISLHYDFFTKLSNEQLNTESKRLFDALMEDLHLRADIISEKGRRSIRSAQVTGNIITAGLCASALLVSALWAAVLRRSLTDKRRADIQMRNLRRLLQDIIDHMPSIIVGVDSRKRVTHWNSEALHLTGHRPENILGRPVEEALPFMTEHIAKLELALTGDSPSRSFRISGAEADLAGLWEVTVYPLLPPEEESEHGAVIRMDNVTERARLEEMMIQTEKMMSVGGLAAGMAHEIRNPLAGIMHNAQNILRRLTISGPKDREAVQEFDIPPEHLAEFLEQRDIFRMLSAIQDSGLRASDIVDNMLAFSRKSDAVYEHHDFTELVDQTVDLAAKDYDLRSRYDFRGIEIIRDYASNLPPVPCERGMIQQVILNILKNGAHAMRENPSNRSPRFTIVLDREEDMLRMDIRDNGPGIPEETKRRIFEPFFTTKEVGEGTGLGLSVSYFIITENHGGRLTVESTPGSGCVFSVFLPFENVPRGAGEH